MNVLFLANNPQIYLEFAIRLEQENIPFWVADNVNDFHHMVSRMCIDIVFADYNFLNFKKFNVYNHLERNNSEILFLFINEPEGAKNLFVNWEDQVNDKYPNRWTKELEDLLRIVANQPMIEYQSYAPTKVSDLLDKIEKNASATQNRVEEIYTTKNTNIRREDALNITEKYSQNEEKKLTEDSTEQQSEMVLSSENTSEEIFEVQKIKGSISVISDKSLLENFLQVKENSNLSYTEYVLLDMFKKKKNEIINTADIAQLLHLPHNDKGKNKIYQCIYRIRLFLQEREEQNVSLIRVAKGCYSLVCSNLDYT